MPRQRSPRLKNLGSTNLAANFTSVLVTREMPNNQTYICMYYAQENDRHARWEGEEWDNRYDWMGSVTKRGAKMH